MKQKITGIILISCLFPFSVFADSVFQDSEGSIKVKLPEFPLTILKDGRAKFMGKVLDCSSTKNRSHMEDGAVFTCSNYHYSLASPDGTFSYSAETGDASLVHADGEMEQHNFQLDDPAVSIAEETDEEYENSDLDRVEIGGGRVEVRRGAGGKQEVIVENPGQLAEEGYGIMGDRLGGMVAGVSGDSQAGEDTAEGLATAGKVLGGLAAGLGGSKGAGKISVKSSDGSSVEIRNGNIRVNSRDGSWRVTSEEEDYDTESVMKELKATRRGSEINIDMPDSVLFDFGSHDIKAGAAKTLKKVSFLIKKKSSGSIILEGHTDSIGSAEANMSLSKRRIQSVTDWLTENGGIPADILEGKAYGESKPIAHNTAPDGSDDPQGRAKNRRVTFRFEAN